MSYLPDFLKFLIASQEQKKHRLTVKKLKGEKDTLLEQAFRKHYEKRMLSE